MKIEWSYFFGGGGAYGRSFDRYYEADIEGIHVEKHASNNGVKFSIWNMDKAKVKYDTEAGLLKALGYE